MSSKTPLPLLVILAEETENAYNRRHKHNLSRQAECLFRTAQFGVMRKANSRQSAVEFQRVAEEAPKRLMLRHFFDNILILAFRI